MRNTGHMRGSRASADSFIEVDGARLRLRDEGQGFPVLLVHGWALDLDMWQPQVAAWAARMRVLRYDRRGFGLSTGSPSLAADMRDIESLLRRLNLQRVAIVGMSQGARGAMCAAAGPLRGRIACLILDGAPFDGSDSGEPEVPLARYRELARTRGAIESQQGALEAVRGKRQAAVDEINSHIDRLSEVEDSLQQKIQEQIAAASGGIALPAGPLGTPSAAGLIWPVSGPITSGYGYRWGRLHEGIDIAVPEGTPIRAAASGTVIIAGYTGGYGNYTCIDHGGGLSTCYGHQSGYAVSAGESVSQGEIIGYSGNTGSSTGPHLHFEVRINGVATDPLGYL